MYLITKISFFLAGQFLISKDKNLSKLNKALYLGAVGIFYLGIGLVWEMVFPIIKKIRTSSFVVFAGGWSLILLSIFYLIIDVWKLRKWSFFFILIGSNSIFIYVYQSGVLDLRRMSNFFFKELATYHSYPAVLALIASCVYLLVNWLFLYFMYKQKIFL